MNVSAEQEVLDHLYELSSQIIQGATLEESLDFIYEAFQGVIPYDRIGYADIDQEHQVVRARWARSKDRLLLRTGYAARLEGSSLSLVIKFRRPRVLNNLPEYLAHRPQSRSTSLIVREGIKSSVTCPLFVNDEPTGFLFFSSCECDTYEDSHVKVLKEIAMHLALLLMASQHSCESPEPTDVSKVESNPESVELVLSQLKAGMQLSAPLFAGTGKLLLATGTQLSQQSIDRLIVLHQRGFLDVETVSVRNAAYRMDFSI